MSEKNQIPAREGWFTMNPERPRLLGSQCQECKTYYFPKHEQYCRNPACESEQFEEIELSHRGKIWSYTSSAYAPPPPFVASEPYKPYAMAAVELAKEQLVIMGQLVRGVGVDDVKIGDEVELALETLFEDGENQHIVWKWRPVVTTNDGSAGGAA